MTAKDPDEVIDLEFLAAARHRAFQVIAKLRREHPQATPDELAELLQELGENDPAVRHAIAEYAVAAHGLDEEELRKLYS